MTTEARPIRTTHKKHPCRCINLAEPRDWCGVLVDDPDDPVCWGCRINHANMPGYGLRVLP